MFRTDCRAVSQNQCRKLIEKVAQARRVLKERRQKLRLDNRTTIPIAECYRAQQFSARCLSFAARSVQDNRKLASVRMRGGIMDELIDRLVGNVGIDKPTAEKAVGIILNFLKKEGPSDQVQRLIDQMPGSANLMESQKDSGGMFDMGGVMGVGMKLMGAGLGMDQVQAIAKEVIAYAREKAGDQALREIVAAVPSLSQFA
jgi:hypothetical protein